jgi:hypothetical protein
MDMVKGFGGVFSGCHEFDLILALLSVGMVLRLIGGGGGVARDIFAGIGV